MVHTSLDPVADLERRLARRGQVRAAVHRWWNDHGLADHPAQVGKRIALALIERRRPDAKRAGMLVLRDLLADHLATSDLAAFERLFAAGHLADDDLVDAFATEVLGALVQRVPGRGEVVRALAEWRTADTAWQRRAACLALAQLAPHGNAHVTRHVFAVCAAVVWSHERADQTAVGMLLRELSRAEPARVEVFFRRHARLMSRACARHAIERLAAPLQRQLLAHHKRTTTI